MNRLLLLLCAAAAVRLPRASPAGDTLTAVVAVRGRERAVTFLRGEQPLIVAHRFCARAGVLDERAQARISVAVRKAIREDALLSSSSQPEIPWAFGGLLLVGPADGAQFAVGEVIPFDVDFLLPPTLEAHAGRGMTVCVEIRSIDSSSMSDESTRAQCFARAWAGRDDAATLHVDAISFSGYHVATLTARPADPADGGLVPRFHPPLARPDSSIVSFTTVDVGESSQTTYFAMTMKDSVISDPMDARGMAFLDGELFFKSTGTSNPGRNYPGIWLPSSGISPRLFLIGDVMSYEDVNRRAIDEDKRTVLQHEGPASPEARRMFQDWVRRGESQYAYAMVDKRFYLEKEQRMCLEYGGGTGDGDGEGSPGGTCGSHQEYQNFVERIKADYSYDLALATTAGSLGDVQAGRFIFGRFYSLKSIAVSVRLAPSAWRANGHWDGALAILRAAAKLGLNTDPAVAASASETSYAHVVGGICQTNDYIHSVLGFPIKGWAEFSAAVCTTYSSTALGRQLFF